MSAWSGIVRTAPARIWLMLPLINALGLDCCNAISICSIDVPLGFVWFAMAPAVSPATTTTVWGVGFWGVALSEVLGSSTKAGAASVSAALAASDDLGGSRSSVKLRTMRPAVHRTSSTISKYLSLTIDRLKNLKNWLPSLRRSSVI